MYYAVLRLELRVRESRSLKEKRAVLLHLKERLRHRYHLSVAEVDYQDLHQRAALGVALVATSETSARDALLAIRREVESDPRAVILDTKSRLGRIDESASSDLTRGGGPEVLAEDDEWTLEGFERLEDWDPDERGK